QRVAEVLDQRDGLLLQFAQRARGLADKGAQPPCHLPHPLGHQRDELLLPTFHCGRLHRTLLLVTSRLAGLSPTSVLDLPAGGPLFTLPTTRACALERGFC